ncbi:interleukin-17F-like, partial [Sceloporus undulatus]|uniref:interleukin-17F-like n=1 Tax=Sceloporus undulatus TaxID=8520 RepID=UPI001C4D8B45
YRAIVLVLILMSTVINTAHGEIKEENTERMHHNCQTQAGMQENTGFPENVKIHIRTGRIESVKIHPNVRNKSLSPWDYRINEDPNRFPHVIAEAKCRHDVCLDFTGRALYHGMNSVPIQQEILVLKRKQIGCQQTYSLEKQLVTVGCTCIIPTIIAYPTKGGRKRRELTYGGKQSTAGRKRQHIQNTLG